MYSNQQIGRVSIGGSGRMLAAELIRQGRNQIGIGNQSRVRELGIGNFSCPPTTSGIPQNCAPPINVCPENQKRYTLPLVPDSGFTATVLAGAQVRFIGRPQKLFKGDRLIIPSTIGPFFDVVQFTIANIPQSLAEGSIPADIFSEVSTYTEMNFDQAYPGVLITLTALNKSAVTQIFQASLIGDAVG